MSLFNLGAAPFKGRLTIPLPQQYHRTIDGRLIPTDVEMLRHLTNSTNSQEAPMTNVNDNTYEHYVVAPFCDDRPPKPTNLRRFDVKTGKNLRDVLLDEHTTLIDVSEAHAVSPRQAKTVSAKVMLALQASLSEYLMLVWPGKHTTDVFHVTPREVFDALRVKSVRSTPNFVTDEFGCMWEYDA